MVVKERDKLGRWKPNLPRERFIVSKWNSGTTKADIGRMLGITGHHVTRLLRKAAASGRYRNILTQVEWEAYYGSRAGQAGRKS